MFAARQLAGAPSTQESGPSARIRLILKHETAQVQLVLAPKKKRGGALRRDVEAAAAAALLSADAAIELTESHISQSF